MYHYENIQINYSPLKRQSQLQQTTIFATSFLVFRKKSIIFHENRLPADDSDEILYFICYLWKKKQQNLKLSSAANYRWRFEGLEILNVGFYYIVCHVIVSILCVKTTRAYSRKCIMISNIVRWLCAIQSFQYLCQLPDIKKITRPLKLILQFNVFFFNREDLKATNKTIQPVLVYYSRIYISIYKMCNLLNQWRK